METADLIFKGFYSTAWLAPVVAFCIRGIVRPFKRAIVGISALSISLGFLAIKHNWSFSGIEADYTAAMLAYIVFVVAWVQITTVNVHPVMKPVRLLLLLPLILVPILCSLMIFAVMLGLGDAIPVKELRISTSTICRVYNYGNATTSDGGYEVNIYIEYPPLENEVYSHRVSTVGSDITPEEACSNAYKQAKI